MLGSQTCAVMPGSCNARNGAQSFKHAMQALYQGSHIPSLPRWVFAAIERTVDSDYIPYFCVVVTPFLRETKEERMNDFSFISMCAHRSVEIRGQPQVSVVKCHPPCFSRLSLLAWRVARRLGWLASATQGSACPYLPGAGIAKVCHCAWLCHAGSGG